MEEVQFILIMALSTVEASCALHYLKEVNQLEAAIRYSGLVAPELPAA